MSMAAPDLEVIKDIPGYKVILKAVIKAQIQQLVEQLAAHTDEESVILTASVSDGTLSHLGSDSGKGFLEEQEDVKTQFLGFCLKRHHKKLQAEKEKERQLSMVQAPLPGQFDIGPGQRRPRLPYQPGPRFSQQGYIRSSGARHEPYRIPRSGRRPSSETSFTETSQGPVSTQGLGSNMENIPMKTEPSDDIQNSDSLNKDDDNTNSSVSTVTNDQSESRTGDNTGNLDSDSVKVEAISESEFELEITGVEPGRAPVPQDNWDPNVSMGMNFDPSQGASGSPGDMSSQQGYSDALGQAGDGKGLTVSPVNLFKNDHSCHMCGKSFKHPCRLREHLKTHAGLRPWPCQICGKHFSLKGNLKKHMITHFVGNKKGNVPDSSDYDNSSL